MRSTLAIPTLVRELEAARARSDELFGLIDPDSLYDRSIAERHRIIFYLGHLEAFDWNLISQHLDIRKFHSSFDRLFAFGIDPDSANLPQDQASDWPSVQEVRSYNAGVRERLDNVLDQAPEELLHVAIEHRLMHEETLAYILHEMPYRSKKAAAARTHEAGIKPDSGPVVIPGGTVILGQRTPGAFGWDNEFQAHEVTAGAFAIGRYKVTNGDYLAFVNEGGPVPHFWQLERGQWCYRGMFERRLLPMDWPVYVTQDQAAQYAMWAGKRLPTEAEYHLSAYGGSAYGASAYRGGECPIPDPVRDNFDFKSWDPVSVTSGAANRFGAVQMVGNGWEWTATAFHPFPGFQPFPFYANYSEPFFDGQHYVLKGASQRTAARLTRPSFRNWYRASYPYTYATFRLVEG